MGLPIYQGTRIRTNPTVTVGAYSANQVVGGIQTLTNAIRTASAYGVLQSVTVVDASGQKPQLSLFFFSSNPAGGTYADHVAITLNAADIPFLLGKVDLATAAYDSIGAGGIVTASPVGLLLQGDASGNVYVVATTTGTPTLTALCMTFNYGIQQA